ALSPAITTVVIVAAIGVGPITAASASGLMSTTLLRSAPMALLAVLTIPVTVMAAVVMATPLMTLTLFSLAASLAIRGCSIIGSALSLSASFAAWTAILPMPPAWPPDLDHRHVAFGFRAVLRLLCARLGTDGVSL